jgi:hypothetical protein
LQRVQLSEIFECMRAEFERCYRTTTPEVRGLIGDGRSLWEDGVRNILVKNCADAKQNFRQAAILTWQAAERSARTSPEDANRLAAESLAFEGLATCMRARAAVGLERRKKLMLEAEGLVSTADISLKGLTSYAIKYSSDIVSIGVSKAFDARISETGASQSPDTTRSEGLAAAVARDEGARRLSPLPPVQRQPPRARARTL